MESEIKHLLKQIKRLVPEQGRIARRNARRAVLGAMKALRNAMNKAFPRIEKPKPPPPPRPEKPPRRTPIGPLVLGSSPRYTAVTGKLFCRLAAAVLETELVRTYENEKADDHSTHCTDQCMMGARSIQLAWGWTDATKWRNVIHRQAHLLRIATGGDDPVPKIFIRKLEEQVLAVWQQFWTGPLAVPDLELAAEHQVFLEQQKKARK